MDKYKHFNHHHELTEHHEIVDFGDGEFIANKIAIPLLKALNESGLKTRSHHMDDSGFSWVCILLDGVEVEIKTVNEKDASRTKHNGKTELLIRWNKKQSTTNHVKKIVKEDMICPETGKHCDDECCPVGSECNVSGGDKLSPVDKQEKEGNWIYDYNFVNQLTEKVNTLTDYEETVSMEQVEAVLIAINYPKTDKQEGKPERMFTQSQVISILDILLDRFGVPLHDDREEFLQETIDQYDSKINQPCWKQTLAGYLGYTSYEQLDTAERSVAEFMVKELSGTTEVGANSVIVSEK